MKNEILVVGAGGIGCEVINNLAMVAFTNVTVLDNDQISLSNLNRQFLFQEEHLAMHKAEVACFQIFKMYALKYKHIICDVLVHILHSRKELHFSNSLIL